MLGVKAAFDGFQQICAVMSSDDTIVSSFILVQHADEAV